MFPPQGLNSHFLPGAQAESLFPDLHVSFSVVMQPESQNNREPDPQDEGEALQEPHVSVLVGLGSCLLLEELRGRLSCSADLREDVHGGHIEKRPG